MIPMCARVMLLTVSAAWLAQASTASAAPPPRLESTFVQLSNKHLAWSPSQWQDLFADFRRLSLTELIVQWSSYDAATFYSTARSGTTSPVETILRLADEGGLKVWVGLAADSTFWEQVGRDPAVVDVHFRRMRLRSLQAARELSRIVPRHSSFAGWYLPEEIDDVNWLDVRRRDVLLNHLRVQGRELQLILPDAPVSISGFSNGRLDPKALAEFWQQVSLAAHLRRVLFQDGIGARKLELEDLPPYLQALRAAFEASGPELGIVVELFQQTSDSPQFAAVPASIERIRKQLELAGRFATAAIVGFAVPEYMSKSGGRDAEQLLHDYLSDSQ
jgi:hypothetical protein